MAQLLYLGQQRLNATVDFYEGLLTEKEKCFAGFSVFILYIVIDILILCVILDCQLNSSNLTYKIHCPFPSCNSPAVWIAAM